MAIKVGISGFGRISRLAIRTAMDMPDIEIAGINYRNADLDYLVYMLKYDSVFGRFPGELGRYEGRTRDRRQEGSGIQRAKPNMIPWDECGAEYIVEGTGAYNTAEKAQASSRCRREEGHHHSSG